MHRYHYSNTVPVLVTSHAWQVIFILQKCKIPLPVYFYFQNRWKVSTGKLNVKKFNTGTFLKDNIGNCCFFFFLNYDLEAGAGAALSIGKGLFRRRNTAVH